MKKTLLLVAGIALHSMYAQVGIETTDPQATLDVNGDVRIQNSSLSDIPSHADCPCFLVVDKQGKVKRVPIDQGSGSGSSSGGGTGSGTGGSTSGGGVPSSEGGVSNPEVLKPAKVVEIGWFTENFEEIDLLVNLPNGVPYSASMSKEMTLPTVDGGTQNFRVTYPKGQVSNGRIKAKLLISGNFYTPKLIFTPAEEKEYEMTLYFNGVEQTAKLKFKATVNAVTNQEHGNTYTYPVTKVAGKYIMAMNLGAQYAKEATTNPGVLKTWINNPNWVSDYKAYGSIFQWGRAADGHELMNWTSSTEGTPVNNSMWNQNPQYTTADNSVCPGGYHLPTSQDFHYWTSALGANSHSGAYGIENFWPDRFRWVRDVSRYQDGTVSLNGYETNGYKRTILYGYGSKGGKWTLIKNFESSFFRPIGNKKTKFEVEVFHYNNATGWQRCVKD